MNNKKHLLQTSLLCLTLTLAATSHAAKNDDEVHDSLEANMKLRQITDRTIDDLMTITSEGNKLTIDLDYEERQHLFFNLDIVIHFKKIYVSEQNTIYGDDN